MSAFVPPITVVEAIDTTRIYSVAGLTGDRTVLVTSRPFRIPPQTISDVGLIDGGHLSRLGERSLAHHGVLVLDALPEFQRRGLEVWCQPPEEGVTRI